MSERVDVLVLYYSVHGNTEAMARQVARGVDEVPEAAAVLRTVPRVSATTEQRDPPVPDRGAPYAEADDLRRCGASVIYGTVRLIERDNETALAWAREPWACVIFNICVEHSESGLRKARRAFRALIDRAITFGGSYYLTYHKFARRDQVEACHPRLAGVLQAKRRLDPKLRFQSDWWHHHDQMLGS